MGLEGRKVTDNQVMFGEPLNERAFEALKRRSPTAEDIIKSLPEAAFIPIDIEKEQKVNVKKQKAEAERKKVEAAREKKRKRIEEKRRRSLEKEQEVIENVVEKTIVKEEVLVKETTILEDIILNNQEEFIENNMQEIAESEPNTMDLEAELEALAQEAKPVEREVPIKELQETAQQDMSNQILSLLKNEKNKPSDEMIEAWKEKYGQSAIHAMAFGEGDIYIYHHLTRGEWKKIKQVMSSLKDSANSEEIEEKLKEKVCLYCVLWPSVDEQWLEYCKAGVLDSLYQMILLNSGFLTPQQAMLLTTQL